MSKQRARKYYALKNPDGDFVHNILEISEPWVFAMMYSRQYKNKETILPSKTPPDFIRALKKLGYKCVEIKEPTKKKPEGASRE